MMSHPDLEEWQVEIRKRNNDPFDLDEIYLYVTKKPDVDEENLTADLKQKIIRETEVSVTNIIYLPLDKLVGQLGMETELKEKRIVDNRPTG